MRLNQAIFSILVSVPFLLDAQPLHVRWTELASPSTEPIRVVGGSSKKNFWIGDAKGYLYHFAEGGWQKFAPPQAHQFTLFCYLQIGPDDFLCAAVDRSWQTSFFRFRRGRWSMDSLRHPNPVLVLKKIGRNDIIAYGDWGSFLRFDGERWVALKTPIHEHITAFAATSIRDIWLGTRGEGIFHYDGNEVRRIPRQVESKRAITMLVVSASGQPFAFTADFQWLTFDGVRFTVVHRPDSSVTDLLAPPAPFGFQAVRQMTPAGRQLCINVPEQFRMVNSLICDDSTIVVASRAKKLLLGTPTRNNVFIDLTATYDVAGSPTAQSVGAAFFDANHDNYPELFLFSPHDDKSRFFFNVPASSFLDITQSAGLTSLAGYSQFAVGDFNNDNSPDLLFSKLSSSGEYIDIFEYASNQRFRLVHSLARTPLYGTEELGNIRVTDFYAHGIVDIDLSNYYSPDTSPGNDVILKNRWWGSSFEPDTSFQSITRGWNWQSVHADFDNDGTNDWLIITKWGRTKLLMHRGDSWIDETEQRFAPRIPRLTFGAGAVDIDNDGDLDLVVTTDSLPLQLYVNDGKGFFQDGTTAHGLALLPQHFLGSMPEKTLNFGDFNNDGFIDIFLTLSGRDIHCNLLFMNEHGMRFRETAEEFGISQPYVQASAVADVDDDGDLDLYGVREGGNVLWINDLNNHNYLTLRLRGITGNAMGIGSKVWLYDAGWVDHPAHLRGFRQVGSDQYGRNQMNDLAVHFGVETGQRYDVRVQFYAGHEVVLSNIAPGQTLLVAEQEGIVAFAKTFPPAVYRLLTRPEVELRLFSAVLGIAVVLSGTLYGMRRFRWNAPLVLFLVMVNLTLFWLLVGLIEDSSTFMGFALPVLAVTVGIALPNVVFVWMQRQSIPIKSIESAREDLLQLLIAFTHGQWALRNINSLLLLCKNVEEHTLDNRFLQQYSERRSTFLELTLPNVNRIVALGKAIGVDPPLMVQVETIRDFLHARLMDQHFPLSDASVNAIAALTPPFEQLKMVLAKLVQRVFATFSCDPAAVAKSITDGMHGFLIENNITLKRFTSNGVTSRVLIRNYELADILDNCVQNAIRAMDGANVRTIELSISRVAPKIRIAITDTGKGIPREQWHAIFEQGYSTSGGQGIGLYQARELLRKYGGRISVERSSINGGTTFIIELNEVKGP